MQNGGCHPLDGCKGPHPFGGAGFRYLAASTVDEATGKTIFPPYTVKRFDGVPVAFIGLTLKGTRKRIEPVGIDELGKAHPVWRAPKTVPKVAAGSFELGSESEKSIREKSIRLSATIVAPSLLARRISCSSLAAP
jgi:5'-nucleotidase